jgi:hypothetical protein
MLSNYARYFSRMMIIITQAEGRLRLESIGHDTPISEPGPDGSEGWADFAKGEAWDVFEKACKDIDLDSAVDQLNRLRRSCEDKTIRRTKLASLLEDLRNRVTDQLGSRAFLYVAPSKVVFWENETLFGEEVFDKISEATTDIYEAGSCFAAGRAGGTVYHCLGIMQATFFKVGRQLGCTIDLELDDWKKVNDKIEGALDAKRKIAEAKGKAGDAAAYAQWKKEETAYNELISDVNAVARAWRHPSAHFRQTYTIEQAKKVLDKVEDFAKHAASLLPDS